MDFAFGFPADPHKITGILVFVDIFSKMVYLVAVPESINASACTRVFIDTIFRLHGLPRELFSNRDPRFTVEFWRSVYKTLGTRLQVSISDHPEIDGQTERAKRVLEEILRVYIHSFTNWSEFLPMVEFFVNGLHHPRLTTFLECNSILRGGRDSFERTPRRLSLITY